MPHKTLLLLLVSGLIVNFSSAQNGFDYSSIRSRSSTGQQVCNCTVFKDLEFRSWKGEKGHAGLRGEDRKVSSNNPSLKNQLPTIVSDLVKLYVQKGSKGLKGSKGDKGDDELRANNTVDEKCRFGLPQNFTNRKGFMVERDLAEARNAVKPLPRYAPTIQSYLIVIDGSSASDDEVYFYLPNFPDLRKLAMTRVGTA